MTAAERVAHQLELALGQFDGRFLPALRDLSRHFGTSVNTMAQACQLLLAKGLLSGGGGARYQIAGEQSVLASPRESNVDRVSREILEAIESCTYRAGQPLPKQTALAVSHRASRSSIAEALGNLTRKGEVTQVGHHYLPGGSVTRTRTNAKILIISAGSGKESSWAKMDNPRTGAFIRTFVAEVSQFGTRLSHLLCPIDEYSGKLREKFLQTIQVEFDTAPLHCLGTLVVGNTGMPGLIQEPLGLADLIGDLVSFGKPCLFVDRTLNPLSREAESRGAVSCCATDQDLVREALLHLREAGHRYVGFAGFRRNDWRRIRADLLVELGAEMGITVVTVGAVAARLKSMSNAEIISYVTMLRHSHSAASRKCINTLWETLRIDDTSVLWHHGTVSPIEGLAHALKQFGIGDLPEEAPSLWGIPSELPQNVLGDFGPDIPLLLDPAITALISPRDSGVGRMQRCLSYMGIRVPDDISMISFDNNSAFAVQSVSSVDAGVQNLGYRAFHAILRDIPVGIDRRKSLLVSKPFVVDLGSVKSMTPS